MKMEEFMQDQAAEELDVQKAVVEELAAEKVDMSETLSALNEKLLKFQTELTAAKNELAAAKAEVERIRGEHERNDSVSVEVRNENLKLKDTVAKLQAKIVEQAAVLGKTGDLLAANAETPGSNKVALLDRDPELPDRFDGETRDHVLEVIAEARDRAEEEGRVRRAQLLEAVMVANEPSGELKKRRVALEKFFNDNANVMTGPVIEQLEKCGISYKNGEEYLLTGEILKRTY